MSITPSTGPVAAARHRFARIGDSEILIADWRDSSPEEVRASMAAVRKLLWIRAGRVSILFDVAGMRWDAKLPFEAVAWMREMLPKTARVAIVGASGLQLTVLSGMRSLSGLPLLVFPSREEAIAWLTRPRKNPPALRQASVK